MFAIPHYAGSQGIQSCQVRWQKIAESDLTSYYLHVVIGSHVKQAALMKIAFFFLAIECHTPFQDPIFSAASDFPPHKFVPYVVNTMSDYQRALEDSTRVAYSGIQWHKGDIQWHKGDTYSGIKVAYSGIRVAYSGINVAYNGIRVTHTAA